MDNQLESFAARLRRLREAANLTQEDLAARAGLTAKGISALERGERRRPHAHTVNVLAAALDLSVSDRAALIASIHARPATAPFPSGSWGTTLPVAPTPLIGREEVVAELIGLIGSGPRLLTLTGPGGVGKTRLALQVAGDVAARFPDGVTFVALAPVADPLLVLPTVAQALGLRETGGQSLSDTVRAFLRDKQLLLVLDNFEHVLGAAPQVAELLANCARLRVLVTSRAVLRLRGERVYPVVPLTLPVPSQALNAANLIEFPAIRLFVERSRDVVATFDTTPATLAAAADICRRLDGLPLAIELAAAWTNVLPIPVLLARMDQALPLLVGGARDLPERQRTMRGTVAWSYNLLGQTEQALFRCLSVFVGGFALEAADAVCETDTALPAIASLLDRSLIVALNDEPRFGMLETIREYGLEQLASCSEEAGIRQRHAHYYLALAEDARMRLKTAAQVEWLGRLEREHDNLRAAVQWSLDRKDAEHTLRLVGALWEFWLLHGHLSEGRRWMEEAVASSHGQPAALRTNLFLGLGMLAQEQGDYDRAMALYTESLELAREADDAQVIMILLHNQGVVAQLQGEYERGIRLLNESLKLAQDNQNTARIAASLNNLAWATLWQGDTDHAVALLEESITLQQAVGDKWSLATVLHSLGFAVFQQAQYERAARLYGESLALALEVGDKRHIAYNLEGLAAVAGVQGKGERAARLWGAAAGVREAIGSPLPPVERPAYDRSIAAARSQTGEMVFTAAWAEGLAMSLEQATAYALDESASPFPPIR